MTCVVLENISLQQNTIQIRVIIVSLDDIYYRRTRCGTITVKFAIFNRDMHLTVLL